MLARGSLCASSHRSPEGALIIASNTVVILTGDWCVDADTQDILGVMVVWRDGVVCCVLVSGTQTASGAGGCCDDWGLSHNLTYKNCSILP